MFSYYGSKAYIAGLYPEPRHRIVIEPFCGAAWYSVLHSDRQVMLNDLNPRIIGVWDWLINEATYEAMLPYRFFKKGQLIGDLPIDDRHRDFIGFCVGQGVIHPSRKATPRGCDWSRYPNFKSGAFVKINRAIQMLPGIRHWSVTFRDASDVAITSEATTMDFNFVAVGD